MKRFYFVLVFVMGVAVGFLTSRGWSSQPTHATRSTLSEPKTMTVVYPVREVTHPGTGENSVVFRTVRLIPGKPSPDQPGWTFSTSVGEGDCRYVEVTDGND